MTSTTLITTVRHPFSRNITDGCVVLNQNGTNILNEVAKKKNNILSHDLHTELHLRFVEHQKSPRSKPGKLKSKLFSKLKSANRVYVFFFLTCSKLP